MFVALRSINFQTMIFCSYGCEARRGANLKGGKTDLLAAIDGNKPVEEVVALMQQIDVTVEELAAAWEQEGGPAKERGLQGLRYLEELRAAVAAEGAAPKALRDKVS